MPVDSTKCSRLLDDFLVAAGRFDDVARREVVDRRQRAELADQARRARRGPLTGMRPRATRQVGGDEHAAGDRLAMPEAPIRRDGLDGVARGVPVSSEHDAARSPAHPRRRRRP